MVAYSVFPLGHGCQAKRAAQSELEIASQSKFGVTGKSATVVEPGVHAIRKAIEVE
jgi:hypothetical protein